jgi:hypothetical protein
MITRHLQVEQVGGERDYGFNTVHIVDFAASHAESLLLSYNPLKTVRLNLR